MTEEQQAAHVISQGVISLHVTIFSDGGVHYDDRILGVDPGLAKMVLNDFIAKRIDEMIFVERLAAQMRQQEEISEEDVESD